MKLSDIRGYSQYGIISSHRAERTPAENQATFQHLRCQLQALGMYWTTIVGEWKGVEEPALLIPHIDLPTIASLAKYYGQDAVVYCGPETDMRPVFINQDGKPARGINGEFGPLRGAGRHIHRTS